METRSDIVTSLGAIRGNVVHHLAGVSRYRALRNIDETMVDIAEFQDLVMPLRKVREQIEGQLHATRGYRALCTIDSIIPQLADVLAFLDESPNTEMPSSGTGPATADTDSGTSTDTQFRTVYTRVDEKEVAKDVVAFADTAPETPTHLASMEGGTEDSTVQPEPSPDASDLPTAFTRDGGSHDMAFIGPSVPDRVDDNQPGPDSLSEEPVSPPVAMLVQPVPPSTHDANEAMADSQDDLATVVTSDHAAREDRAA